MHHSSPSYRRATIADLDRMCELGQVVNRLHHEAWPEVFAPEADPKRDEAHWRRSLQDDMAAAFVADADGAVVGFVTVHIVEETSTLLQPMRYGRVGSVCVAEQARGRGVGRALMLLAQQWAKQHQAAEVRLNVWTFNTAAVRLYEELGYEARSLMMAKPLGFEPSSSA